MKDNPSLRQIINRIIHPVDYYYYRKLWGKIDEDGGIPLAYLRELVYLIEKYG